jgi:hypothetical protein
MQQKTAKQSRAHILRAFCGTESIILSNIGIKKNRQKYAEKYQCIFIDGNRLWNIALADIGAPCEISTAVSIPVSIAEKKKSCKHRYIRFLPLWLER